MILLLAALPLAVACAMLLLGRWRLLAVPISVGSLAASAVLALSFDQGSSTVVLGRTFGITPDGTQLLALCYLLVALVLLATFRTAKDERIYALALGAIGFVVAAMMVRNLAISALLLEISAILAVMLIPADNPRAPITSMYALIQFILAGMLFLVAAWALEGQAAPGDANTRNYLGGAAYVLGLAMALAVVPFHLWIPPAFRQGNPLAAIVLTVALQTAMLSRLSDMVLMANWPGGQEFFSAMLLGGGLITVLVGSLAAIAQRSLGGVLAYASIADLGLVLLMIGLGTPESVHLAQGHLAYRAIAITLLSLALISIRQCVDQDDVSLYPGLARRAPLAVIALAAGGLSLVGLPPLAGFASRVAIFRMVSFDRLEWAILLAAASSGAIWAVLRCLIESLRPSSTPDLRREQRWPGWLAMPLVAILLWPSLLPRLAQSIPSDLIRRLLGL
jgi:formate hydrogenlyase subunit 3/multisubunit Na+/H+ antiporter MnhD subunit